MTDPTDRDEGTTEGQGTPQDDLQEPCRSDEELPRFPSWAEQAWRLYCRGQRNWSALGRQFGVDYRTIKSNVRKFGDMVRAAASGSGVDPWQEAVTAQEEILSEAWRIHTDATATNAEKTAALKLAQDAVEKVAALKGVVTKREARVNTGTVKVEHGFDALAMLKDPAACAKASELIAVLSGQAVTETDGNDTEGLDAGAETGDSEDEPGGPGMGAD